MFLLIRNARVCDDARVSEFTFHNVSINSSMALAIRRGRNTFTFHNVSINSQPRMIRVRNPETFTFHNVSINSMTCIFIVFDLARFTFHNVSINSFNQRILTRLHTQFTFHNVSINSRYLIFLIFPTFSLLFLSTLDSICVFPLYSHLKIIIYLLFMPLSMSPVFYFIEHRQFYNFIFLTAYAISFNFLNVYSYFSTYQQTHCNIIKLQLRIIFFILNRL